MTTLPHFWSERLTVLAAALLLAGCAAGPDFRAPAAPADRTVLATALPTHTAASNTAFGQAQHFTTDNNLEAPW